MGKRAPHFVHLPDWRLGNPYQSLLQNALEVAGCTIVFDDYPEGLFPMFRLCNRHRDADGFHLHWVHLLIEPAAWPTSRFAQEVKLMLFRLDLLLVRLRGKKLVWTVHNVVAHESYNERIELRGRKYLARVVNRLLFHSAGALRLVERTYGLGLAGKATISPHGNFDGCYVQDAGRSEELKAAAKITDATTTFLFIGAVRPYKGIDKLIKAFRGVADPQLRLLVVGKPWSEEIKSELESLAQGDERIHLDLAYIRDEDIAPYLSVADAVVIPFERTLTSSSVILAMTHGKAVVLPENARHLDVVTEEGGYFFDDVSSLAQVLRDATRKKLAEMGTANRRRADTLDWVQIGRNIRSLYEEL